MSHPRRIVVGISGATGTIFGIRLLELLRQCDVETHLILSKWGARTLLHETSYSLEQVRALATVCHQREDQGAALSSGSFITEGMVIAPCSMKTLAAIATGVGDNLLSRSADVALKERRKLVILPREAPLNSVHLENMLKLSRLGVVVIPPVPAFYNHPSSLEEMVDHIAQRVLDQFQLHLDLTPRWAGRMKRPGEVD